jgi:hypothetical protein
MLMRHRLLLLFCTALLGLATITEASGRSGSRRKRGRSSSSSRARSSSPAGIFSATDDHSKETSSSSEEDTVDVTKERLRKISPIKARVQQLVAVCESPTYEQPVLVKAYNPERSLESLDDQSPADQLLILVPSHHPHTARDPQREQEEATKSSKTLVRTPSYVQVYGRFLREWVLRADLEAFLADLCLPLAVHTRVFKAFVKCWRQILREQHQSMLIHSSPPPPAPTNDGDAHSDHHIDSDRKAKRRDVGMGEEESMRACKQEAKALFQQMLPKPDVLLLFLLDAPIVLPPPQVYEVACCAKAVLELLLQRQTCPAPSQLSSPGSKEEGRGKGGEGDDDGLGNRYCFAGSTNDLLREFLEASDRLRRQTGPVTIQLWFWILVGLLSLAILAGAIFAFYYMRRK